MVEVSPSNLAEAERALRPAPASHIVSAYRHSVIPTVAAALQVKQDRIEVLEAALIEARDTFRNYGDLHAAKPDPVKADRNYSLASRMNAALAGVDIRQSTPASTGGKGEAP